MVRVIIKFRILTLAFLAVAITAPKSLGAISTFGCSDRGVELRSDFSVKVKFQGRPLPGVSIEVKGADVSAQQSHSELTGPDGLARFADMPPGNYWMKAEFLGIAARYECFHINSTPSSRAKKNRQYEWGTMPVGIREVVGRLIDSQPGKEGTPVERMVHRVNLPITGAKLELRQPLSGATYTTESDATGHFQFDKVSQGIYVLHIDEDSNSGNQLFDSSDFLIELGSGAKTGTLLITRGIVIASPRMLSLTIETSPN